MTLLSIPDPNSVWRVLTVTTDFLGFHCYPDAPTDVAFLRNTHRHLFKVRAAFKIRHNDRELEFFQLQAKLTELCVPLATEMRQRSVSWSCEAMAEHLLRALWEYTVCAYSVTVSEDGENEATITFYT